MKTIKYEDYREIARTFDWLLFDDKNWLWRNVVGHVAMVITNNSYDQVLCWESTSNGLGGQSGVQLNCLSARLKDYGGTVKVRRMFCDDKQYERSRLLLPSFVKSERGKPYPPLNKRIGHWYVINAGIDLPFGLFQNKPNDKWRFCSDVLGATYEWCNLCNLTLPSCELKPQDFHRGRAVERMLTNCSMGDELEIIL